MKTLYQTLRMGIVVCLLALAVQLSAQEKFRTHLNYTIDWQFNSPIGTDFADRMSVWGMNVEVAYALTQRLDVGAFLGFHTNHKYVDRRTIAVYRLALLTTDQQRSAYHLPFGATMNFAVYRGDYVYPYVGLKMGAMFGRYTTYYGSGGIYDQSWGFYVSPEIGLRIYPVPSKRWGIHVAGYYSYGTNDTQTLTHMVKGQSNLGLRIGVLF